MPQRKNTDMFAALSSPPVERGILTLPHELQLTILDFLDDPADVHSLRQTCFVLYGVCLSRRKPPATFQQAPAPLSMMLASLRARLKAKRSPPKMFIGRLESVTIIALRGTSTHRNGNWNLAGNHPLTRPCPHLAPRLFSILRSLYYPAYPRLKHLRLDINESLFAQPETRMGLENLGLRGLASLQIDTCRLSAQDFISSCENIQQLHVQAPGIRHLGDERFETIRTLWVTDVGYRATTYIETMWKHFPNLSVLGLEGLGCNGSLISAHINAMEKWLVKIPTLRSLILTPRDLGIEPIDWPPHTPDLNHIEHVWKRLKELVYELYPEFEDLKDNQEDRALAKQWIQDAWQAIDQDFIRSLIDSVPRRRLAVR